MNPLLAMAWAQAAVLVAEPTTTSDSDVSEYDELGALLHVDCPCGARVLLDAPQPGGEPLQLTLGAAMEALMEHVLSDPETHAGPPAHPTDPAL